MSLGPKSQTVPAPGCGLRGEEKESQAVHSSLRMQRLQILNTENKKKRTIPQVAPIKGKTSAPLQSQFQNRIIFFF